MLLLEFWGLSLRESNNHIAERFECAAVKMLVYVETAVRETVIGKDNHIGNTLYPDPAVPKLVIDAIRDVVNAVRPSIVVGNIGCLPNFPTFFLQ
jgi:hypothetical protein